MLLGGATFSLLHLIMDMKRRHNVEPVLLVDSKGNFADECRKNGIEVIIAKHYGWFYRDNVKIKGIIKYILNRFYCYGHVLRLLKNQHFDIVHTNTSGIQTGDMIAHHFGIPHVWHIREHGTADHNMHYTQSDDYVRSRYSASAVNVAISRSVYNELVNRRRLLSSTNTRIIYNGIKIPAAYDKEYTRSGTVNFCITGSVYEGKNQLMAIKACKELADRTDKFILHIIGQPKRGYEDYNASLREYVSSHGLESVVKFWGFRTDVNELLKTMDVGLMLSRCEGFGRVTVEYMLNYMPVIGTNTGGTPEIVLDGETGYLCPLNDSDKLAQLMHNFIIHPELLRTMGEKGRERAVTHFSVERNTDQIYSLYQEILGR